MISLHFKKIIAACMLFAASGIACADNLLSILDLAIQVNSTLLESEQNMYATMELLPQARAALLPIINGSIDTAYTNTNDPTIGNNNTWSYTATITQPIINLASWFQYRQVDDQIKSSIANYEDTRQALIVQVTEQYFAILKARDDYVFTIAEKKAFAQQLEQTHQKFKAGVIAITDVNEAQARYDSANAQVIAAFNELFNQKEIMGEITGVPATQISTLIPNIDLAPPPDTIDQWVDTARLQNFSLQSLRYNVAAAKKNINIQRAGHFPVLQANGSASKAKQAPPFAPLSLPVSNTNVVGLSVTMPLYSGGSINALTRQAAHEYEISLQQMITTERQVVSNVRQAYRGIFTQISQVAALKQLVISSKSALDATQAAFNVGTRTIVDVLNAESDLLNALRELSRARYNYILESFKLKRFSGILKTEDAVIINQWLEPATNLTAENRKS